MAAVHPFAASMPLGDFSIYVTLLRFFTLLTIPAAGLQIVFAQQAAGAVTEEAQKNLAAAVRAILFATLMLWGCMLAGAFLARQTILSGLGISNPAALWMILVVVLLALLLPTFQGLLQGLQNFLWLGFSILAHGFGRFAAIASIVLLLHGGAVGAVIGVLTGVLAALLICLPPTRKILRLSGGTFHWAPWLRRMGPLTLGVGATLFVSNADLIVVKIYFPARFAGFYGAAATIGVALLTFTTPLAAVMFPKVVRSLARSEKTDAFWLALIGTALMGGAAALMGTLWPALPLRILYFRTPEFLWAAPLVPWLLWAMLPLTLANVLIVNLLARARFGIVPFLLLIACGYGVALVTLARRLQQVDPHQAFRSVAQLLGIFSLLLLAVALGGSWKQRTPDRAM